MKENIMYNNGNSLDLNRIEFRKFRFNNQQKEVEYNSDDVQRIFDFWNNQKIIVHRKLDNRIIQGCLYALNKYSVETIITAIDNYSTVLKYTEINSSNYKPYVWGLREFLIKENAMPSYLSDGCKWINFNSNKKKTIVPISSGKFNLQTFNDLCDTTELVAKSIPYAEYIKSNHWLGFREKAIINASCICQICGGKEHLNVHHKNYDCLGRETFSDVVVLCRPCHATYHGKKTFLREAIEKELY